MAKDTIGRYEVLSEIGRGGMATVYLAYDPNFRRNVAVKFVTINLQSNPTFRARFEREARLIAAIEHPAIVPVYDFGEQNDRLYLVMRNMPGGTLTGRIRANPLALRDASRIISQIAPGLDAVHSQGIIHRDLKPANILFDAFGNPAISDFGIAHLNESSGNLTGSAVLGTPSYMSPEQISSRVDLDGRSDVYSMGVILFEMLTGRTPYRSPTPLSLAMKHLTEPVPHIRSFRPDLPVEIESVLEKVLAKDREFRYGSAAEFAHALDALSNKSSKEGQSDTGPRVILSTEDASTEIDAGEAAHPSLNLPPALPGLKIEIPDPPSGISPSRIPSVDQPAASISIAQSSGRFSQPVVFMGVGLALISICVVLGLAGVWAGFQLPALFSHTPLPNGTPVVSPQVLFSDNFTDTASGWPTGQNSKGAYGYNSGGYHINITQRDSIMWASTDRQYDNTRMSVDATALTSGREGYYGLLCRIQDDQNFYYFVIRNNADYTIGKYKNGQFESLFSEGWKHSDVILSPEQTNRIEANCVGNTLGLGVNGVMLSEVVDTDFISGKSGLAAAALDAEGLDILFNHFLITKP